MVSVSRVSVEAETALSAESTIALTFSPPAVASEEVNPAATIAVRCCNPNAIPSPVSVLPAAAFSIVISGDIIASYALLNDLPFCTRSRPNGIDHFAFEQAGFGVV